MTGRHLAALPVVAVLAAFFCVVVPLRQHYTVAHARERVARDPLGRVKSYLEYVVFGVLVVAAAAAALALGDDGPRELGAWWPPGATRRLVPVAIVGGATYALAATLGLAYAARRDPESMTKEAQYRSVEFILPRTGRERALWPVLCVAVSVIEEAVYRGVLMLYLAHLTGVSPWWFVPVLSVAFGFSHRYQGGYGIATTAAFGLALSVGTILTGSLWPAVVVHWAVNVYALRLKPPAPAAPVPAPGSAPPPAPPG